MPEIKQPPVKAHGLQRNVTGMATPAEPAPAKPEAAGRKVAKTKTAGPAKKKVARNKTAGAAKKASPASQRVSTAAATTPSSSPASKVSASATKSATKPALSPDARQRMISEAAYLISLKRHAGAGGPDADWLYAETVIDLAFDIED